MATYNPPAMDAGLGIPAQTSDVIGARPGPLFLSSHPAPLTQSYPVAASQTLAANTVVGLDANGRLVKATWDATPASRIDVLGVLAEAITTDASTNYKGALVYTAGNFNDNRLVWDASFTTDAQKQTVLAKAVARITVGEPKSYTP